MSSDTPRYILTSGALVAATDGLGNPCGDWVKYSDHERDLAAAKEELAQERERADKAEELAKRSTARLVEMSDPGFIGAFAARDHWKERAERAEARAEANERDAERYRWIRDVGSSTFAPFCSTWDMAPSKCDAAIDAEMQSAAHPKEEA